MSISAIAATEHDVIDVQAYGFSDWTALQGAIRDNASGNAVIQLSATDSIELVGVQTANLLQTDFLFTSANIADVTVNVPSGIQDAVSQETVGGQLLGGAPPASPPGLAHVVALFNQFVAGGFPDQHRAPISNVLSHIVTNQEQFLAQPHHG
jgi:hypothetical protein